MASGYVPAMSWPWQSWKRRRANLRAQRTLQKPAGAEGPVWAPHTNPFPSGGLWADRGAWALPTAVLSFDNSVKNQ